MPQSTRRRRFPVVPKLTWDSNTELVSLQLSLQPHQELVVPPHYSTELHSWFLDQVRRIDSGLSTYLHDGQSEKPFTISQLQGPIQSQGRSLKLMADSSYHWNITALSNPVVKWMNQWLQSLPNEIHLRNGSFKITDWNFAYPPTTYAQLAETSIPEQPSITLSFLTPTSFRRKGNHLPLPMPVNVFHSYLCHWSKFSGEEIDQDDFLDWVDEFVIILRHQIQSAKVIAGKSGSVTGFTGSVQFGLSSRAKEDRDYVELWLALGQFAPYCGTGHKTTFGLGQTAPGWLNPTETAAPFVQNLLAQRISELTEVFAAQRKRRGGDRTINIAETWATILARREMGESLKAIAEDLEMPYETVRTYAKLARRALKQS
ncbi:CRISPR-associated endoribonuclease Cas6 [Leptothermofonsia sp. ETS-13]|uniref:CRISPR-associated endoribonuclease Cas6 n=1 Tax=Leptothermofonsia sp. ETS-13 TaxID=3035696 RepID=UPI003B9E3AAC